MTAVSQKHDPVTIADRRELPFFMVYTRAVEAIREHTAGPRRVRTIGFYGLLCQLANEQRNIGQQRRVRYTYDRLAARGGVSKGNIAKMLSCLEQAGVLRRETQADPGRGDSISIAHLLIHQGGLDPLRSEVIGVAVETGCRFHSSLAFPDLVHAGHHRVAHRTGHALVPPEHWTRHYLMRLVTPRFGHQPS